MCSDGAEWIHVSLTGSHPLGRVVNPLHMNTISHVGEDNKSFHTAERSRCRRNEEINPQ